MGNRRNDAAKHVRQRLCVDDLCARLVRSQLLALLPVLLCLSVVAACKAAVEARGAYKSRAEESLDFHAVEKRKPNVASEFGDQEEEGPSGGQFGGRCSSTPEGCG
jgi:hypothetical protein